MDQTKFFLHLKENLKCCFRFFRGGTLEVFHFASSFSFSTISGVLNDLQWEANDGSVISNVVFVLSHFVPLKCKVSPGEQILWPPQCEQRLLYFCHLPVGFFLPTSFKFASLLSSMWWIAPATWKAISKNYKHSVSCNWVTQIKCGSKIFVGFTWLASIYWLLYKNLDPRSSTWLASIWAPSWLLSSPLKPRVPSASGRLISFWEVQAWSLSDT